MGRFFFLMFIGTVACVTSAFLPRLTTPLASGIGLERGAAPNQFTLRLIAPAHAQVQVPSGQAPAPNATETWDEFLKKIPQPVTGGSVLDPSIRGAREQFLVVLGRSTDKTQAENDLATARTRFPDAQLVLREGQFLILRGSQPADLNNATLDVLAVERAPVLSGQKPTLNSPAA